MGELISQGGPVGLLSLGVVLILTGRLVPRSTLRDVQTERDTWREAHRVSEEARRLDREQLGELAELGRTSTRLLTALPRGEVSHGTAAEVGDASPR
ncbi:hypothetical protein [Actinacidiphila sp. ITFR-21]|uniref:hypothetical protein n=1 Tax=Actinacidiphila sp. ITFR-21 TaxID=3075199 RepID=UPI00288B00FF|nr:hypothetical protein [Streptomyces sp. ITFR-21]WNI15585.1 hypothetical protein RLT57_08620 [Streptomyces sp. ITFR-21]